MKDSIIVSKIQAPKESSAFILRKQLLDKLIEEEKKLFFLHATVGYGKTVLLTQLAGKTDALCAWYHLSDTDNDTMTFMQYLYEAVKKVHKDFVFDWSSYGGLMQSEELLDAIICDFSTNLLELVDGEHKKLFLIFDDFQTIKNEEIYRLIEGIMNNTSQDIRLFIATRGAIPAFFMRYFVQGSTEFISQEELCFEKEEIGELIDPFVSPKEKGKLTELVVKHTEGWPAGVMFAVLYLKQNHYRVAVDDTSVIYERTVVHGYIMHEIYRKLPYDMQLFLAETSVLDFLSADICNAVTGRINSQSILDYLVQENLFILRMGHSDKVFRYHSLFKDFLNKIIKEEKEKEILNKAADFYLNNGSVNIESREQAVEYAIRSGNGQLVQYALEGIGMEMLNQGKLVTLERWVAFITEEQLQLTSQNMLISGAFFYQRGNVEKALDYIDRASEMFLSAMDENGYVRCMLEKTDIVRNCRSVEESNEILDQIMPRLKNRNSTLLFAATKERLYNSLFLCRYKEALVVCGETILTARRLGNKKIERQFAMISVVIYFYMGKYGRALEIYDTFSKDDSAEINQTDPFSVNAYAALMMVIFGREEEGRLLIDRELEQKPQKKKEDIWVVYLFKACICAMPIYYSHNKNKWNKKENRIQARKALDIAEKYTDYWAENHVFHGYIEAVKGMLTLDFDDLQWDQEMCRNVEAWKESYPFARDFAMGHLALALYRKGDVEKGRECAKELLRKAKTENLFVIYGRVVAALTEDMDENMEEAVKNAVMVEAYLQENKLIPSLLSKDDKECLAHLLDEGKQKASEAVSDSPKIRVEAFGNFEVYLPRSETPMKFRTKKAQELFAYLFHLQGGAATKEAIMAELWPESGEKSGTSLLHTTIYGIRKVLNDCDIEELISYKDRKYKMNMSLVCSDLLEFQEMQKALKKGLFEEVKRNRKWTEIYKGCYLENIDCQFCVESRAYYEGKYLKICRFMAKKEIETKDYEGAAYYLTKALRVDSYGEDLHLLLIKSYGKMGNVKMAKQAYEIMKHIWIEELLIEPRFSLKQILNIGATNKKDERQVDAV